MAIQTYDPRLESAAVRERFSDPTVYSWADDWHRFTAARIRREVADFLGTLLAEPGRVILNAGAGNNDLGICPPSTINLDISESGVSGLPNPVIASVEDIPLPTATVDTVICVGSVINYCDAAAAISEFARILRPAGQLVLEFESSLSAEFIGKASFGRPAAIAETFYQGAPEVVRVYDPQYVRSLLSRFELTITRTVPIHIASPWALLATQSAQKAAIVARLDPVLREAPFLSRWAANQVFFCTRCCGKRTPSPAP